MRGIQRYTANWFLSLGVLGCVLLSTSLISFPAQSAEEISIRYRVAQRSISVEDLDTFVTTGEIPRSLQWYANRLTEEEQAILRTVLQRPLAVEPNVITTFVRDPAGESLLRRLLVMFWGGLDDEALFKALRASLVLAATDDTGLTIMNFIQKYPLSQVRIDLNVALEAAEDLKKIIIDSDNIFAAIQQKAIAPSPDQLPPNFTAPGDPGTLTWEKREIAFNNPKRGFQELVTADVYLPQGLDVPAPLIVISHGVASSRATFAYLAEHLASHGFAVAAIEHPDTDALRFQQYINGFAEQPNPKLFVQRPNDITALLDDLEQKIAELPTWQGRLRTDRVGIFGQSLGGYTVLAAGGAQLDFDYLMQSCQDAEKEILPFNLSLLLQCQLQELPQSDGNLRDDRVAAVLAVNPVSSSLFGPRGMSQLQVPIMMVASSHDFVTPAVDEQIVPFTWLETEERYLVFIENGTHFTFLTGSEDAIVELPKQLIGPDPELAQPTMQWMATTFFETYINGSSEHESFLAELLLPSSSGDFEYALTRSFTQADLDAAVRLSE
ncbi:alpha/beta hydrolase [Synechococcus sp. PCC 7336]|uniref:alpha/beta hydrolase n=1 Tax=Synechococcus sp. PCC 7336 TaxID=195250 RepID=UPI00068837E8|nr:alpha/beta hydrolase [Synechococcus sp. PCC 7336]